jgi:hypothetical protein
LAVAMRRWFLAVNFLHICALSEKTRQMIQEYDKDIHNALEAKDLAQWIAFGPIIFQAARVMRNNGMLKAIEDAASNGISQQELVDKLQIPNYGVRVLLEAGLGMHLFYKKDELYFISRTGYFILHDGLTNVNMDFVHDICYKGMFWLDKSIETGKPEGLKELGTWDTIYEGLSQLPPQLQKSWFAFDHFFSDMAFGKVLNLVMDTHPKRVIDIGGNTGKWTMAAAKKDPNVHITMVDLPGQLKMAKEKIEAAGLSSQVSFHPINILDESNALPKGHDTIFMSQFLDCFSEPEIESIMRRCYDALDEHGTVFILEAFWDRQRFETAAFCLQQTSLYFTCLANGNSQMYDSKVFNRCVENAGFVIVKETNDIGLSHTLLECKKKTN